MRSRYAAPRTQRNPQLFWCTTASGAEDYWVVAFTSDQAKMFFAVDNGFRLNRVSAVRVCSLPPESWTSYPRPETPSVDDLSLWGIKYNEAFHVFHYNGAIYRPEATVRRLLAAGKLRREA